MPWKETCRMDERVPFIGQVLSGNAGMAALCREFGISRKTDYKWLERYRREVMAGLAEHSHVPLRHGRALDVTVVQAVLGLRERWPRGVPASCARSCRSATRSCRCRRRARSGNGWAAPGCSGRGAASPLPGLYRSVCVGDGGQRRLVHGFQRVVSHQRRAAVRSADSEQMPTAAICCAARPWLGPMRTMCGRSLRRPFASMACRRRTARTTGRPLPRRAPAVVAAGGGVDQARHPAGAHRRRQTVAERAP